MQNIPNRFVFLKSKRELTEVQESVFDNYSVLKHEFSDDLWPDNSADLQNYVELIRQDYDKILKAPLYE